MSPVEVEIRRNRHGSVLAYSDRDRASRLLANHRAVLQSLYDLIDRRHGTDGDVVARLHVRDQERSVKGLDLADRFRRDLEADRAIALVEDVRYHAGERELVTDGGVDQPGDRADRRVCLDLFSGLGGREDTEHGFSSAFQAAEDWEVATVDIREEFDPNLCADVLDLQPSDLRKLIGDYDVLVVLAGHPCTLFTTAGNHAEWDLEAREPVGQRAQRHTTMLFHTIGLIRALAPDYWYLENPRRSRINWLIGPPEATVTYCQYGMDYQKPTGLWGDHAPGMTYKSCPRGANCHVSNTEDDGTSAVRSMPSDTDERSLFPRELSEAIRDAVETAIETPQPTQSELPLVTDGGRERGTANLHRITDALELQNAHLLQLVQDRRQSAARNDPSPDRAAPSDHATATDVVDAYGDLYGDSADSWVFDPVREQAEDMGDSR